MAGITPSQTVGPYFHYGLAPRDYDFSEVFHNNLVTPDASGERIRIEGRVTDADGQGINDSMVEIWQADSAGRPAGAAQCLVQRVRARRDRRQWRLQLRDHQAGRGTGSERRVAGAAHRSHGVLAWHAAPPLHAHLFFRRGEE